MTRLISILILLLSAVIVVRGESKTSAKAKAAFAFADIKLCQCKKCTCKDCKCTDGKCVCKDCSKCQCLNCDCKNCQCKDGECKCKNCHSFEVVYVKAVKEGQVVVLEIAGVPHLTNTPWRVIRVKSIQGEKPGYIVGVPKDGELIRIDFPIYTSRERIRLDILHVLYPLTDGYVECPLCPQGRIKNGRQ